MKNWMIFIFSCMLSSNSTLATQQLIDKVKAIVNNNVILESEVNNMLSMIKQSAQKTNQKIPDDATLRRKILDDLIADNIILELARRNNIIVSDEQLDQAINNITEQNYISLAKLRRTLVYNGIDYAIYREQIRKELLISEVRNREIHHRISILPQEVESLAQQIANQRNNNVEFNLSYIFIPLPTNPTQNQINKVEMLATFLINKSKISTDFNQLAITYSSDTQLLKAGLIGWKKLDELPLIFTTHLQGVKKGSVTGLIRSDSGFYILKVNDIRISNQKLKVTEIHLRHILVRTSIIMTDLQAYTRLEDIAKQIKNGSISFNTAAKKFSEDFSSANSGGDLGWNPINIFDPIFREALMNLKRGEISIPIHSSSGWHLIQLIDIREVARTYLDKKDYAYLLLFNRKFEEEVQNWIQEKRASTYVKIIDDNNE